MRESYFAHHLAALAQTRAVIDFTHERGFTEEERVLQRLASDHCQRIFMAFGAACISGTLEDTPRWFFVGGPWHGAFLWEPQTDASVAAEYTTGIVGIPYGQCAAWVHESYRLLVPDEADRLSYDAMVRGAQEAGQLGDEILEGGTPIDLSKRPLPEFDAEDSVD